MERLSGTAMATRLGFKPGMRVWFHDMPAAIREAIAPERAALEELGCATEGVQGVHLFSSRRDHLARELTALRGLLAANGFCWVSWPDQGNTGELGEQMVADVAAAHGWEQSDRCSFDGWAGVKLIPHVAAATANSST